MKSVVAQLILVLILVAAGIVLWTVGAAEQRIAGAERTLATLRYDRAAEELETAAATNAAERLIADVTGMATEAADTRRKAAYWLGDVEEFLRNDDDPSLKMLAADASYRALRAEGGTWQSVTTRLDAIAKRYADVLREQPQNEDAAYNYEFVVRLRTAVAEARRPIAPLDLDATGLTVHGHAGAPPEGSDTKKFKMIVPMRPDERMEAEQAGRGAQKIRKG
jgi:hypothetical protein